MMDFNLNVDIFYTHDKCLLYTAHAVHKMNYIPNWINLQGSSTADAKLVVGLYQLTAGLHKYQIHVQCTPG